MSEIPSVRKVIRFGEFELDLQTGHLFKQEVKVKLREQWFVALSVLLENAGEVVSRKVLQKRLWPGDTLVDFELNLNTVIAKLREALGDSPEHPRYIETLPKRGYRFLAVPAEYPEPELVPKRRIKVIMLPFSNLGGKKADECFSDAMTDEMITALCQVAPEHLAVIARTTAMRYKGTRKDIASIGSQLGVDYIVEGGVSRDKNKLAMRIQLIQTIDQTHLFAQKYNAELSNVVEVSTRAAADITTYLGIPSTQEDKRLDLPAGKQIRKKLPEDLTAYKEYIQARNLMAKGSAEGFVEAKRLLERSIERDPDFSLAFDALAEINWYLGYFGYIQPQKAFSAGIAQALRAIEIDNTRAETHALLGQFHKTIEYNWSEVHREMTLALKLDPNSPLVRLRYAVSDLMPHGRIDEAIAEIEYALEFDPLSILTQGWLGIMLVLARRWDAAINQAHLLLQLDSQVFWGHFLLGIAFRAKQKFEEALASLRMALKVSSMPGLMGWLGMTLGICGKAAEARSLLKRLQTKATHNYVPPTSFAWIHLGLGEIDTAFIWLSRAVDECDQIMMPIKSFAFFDPIRTDPRFLALLKKMNLALP